MHSETDAKRERWGMLPGWALQAWRHLRPSERDALVMLCLHARGPDGIAAPTVAAMSAATGMSGRSVLRGLAGLARLGLIQRVRGAGRGRGVTYRVTAWRLAELPEGVAAELRRARARGGKGDRRDTPTRAKEVTARDAKGCQIGREKGDTPCAQYKEEQKKEQRAEAAGAPREPETTLRLGAALERAGVGDPERGRLVAAAVEAEAEVVEAVGRAMVRGGPGVAVLAAREAIAATARARAEVRARDARDAAQRAVWARQGAAADADRREREQMLAAAGAAEIARLREIVLGEAAPRDHARLRAADPATDPAMRRRMCAVLRREREAGSPTATKVDDEPDVERML